MEDFQDMTVQTLSEIVAFRERIYTASFLCSKCLRADAA
jgi:hypothetical protein